MLLREAVPPLGLGLVAFTLLMVSAILIRPTLDFMVEYNVPLSLAGKLFLMGLPQIFAYTIPMSMLLGTLIAFGRLSSDHELVALRAAGYSLARIVAPVFALGLVMSVTAFLINEKLAVHLARQVKQIKNQVIERKTGAIRQEEVLILFKNPTDRTRWVLMADRLEGDRLYGVRFFFFGKRLTDDWWLRAPEAEWTGNDWKFYQVMISQQQADGSTRTIKHETMEVKELRLSSRQLRVETLSSEERDFWEQLDFIRRRALSLPKKQVLKELTELYMKVTVPFSAAFFVLIAVPLGIIPERTTTTTGFGIALFLVFGYYVVLIASIRLAQAGVIAPLAASLIPNTVVALVGLGLIWWKNRRG